MRDQAMDNGLVMPFTAKIKSFYNKKNKTKTPQNYIISKWFDFICLGGIGIIMIPLLVAFTNYGEDNHLEAEFKNLIFYLAFILNYPHFIHSYQLLYESYKRNNGQNQKLNKRFKQIIYIIPLIFFAISCLGLIAAHEIYFRILISLMFFLVGWHYVKQGYGVFMLSCNINNIKFSNNERKTILTLCYAVWITAWGLNNAGAISPDSFGISAINVRLPEMVLAALMLISLSATFEFIRLLIIRYLKQKPLPNFVALSSFFVSIYIWMFFTNIAYYFLLIPALHSLQYLTITYHVKAKQVNNSIFNKDFYNFVIIGICVGALSFIFLPNLLDSLFGSKFAYITPTIFSLIIISFINIHHYFIDSVIWKKENRLI